MIIKYLNYTRDASSIKNQMKKTLFRNQKGYVLL